MENASSIPRDTEPQASEENDTIESVVDAELLTEDLTIVQQQPTVNDPQKVFPWAKLPAEIRNRIYEFALTMPHGVMLGIDRSRGSLFNETPYCCSCVGRMPLCHDRSCVDCACALAPNLLLINKRTYGEGVAVLYGNELYFDSIDVVERFLASRRPGARQHATRLVVNMEEPHWMVFMELVGLGVEAEEQYGAGVRDVAPRAFEVFSAACRYFEALGTGDEEDGADVVRLRLLCGGWTDRIVFGRDAEYLMPEMIGDAVRGKLEELVASRVFKVLALVVGEDARADIRWYMEREDASGISSDWVSELL